MNNIKKVTQKMTISIVASLMLMFSVNAFGKPHCLSLNNNQINGLSYIINAALDETENYQKARESVRNINKCSSGEDLYNLIQHAPKGSINIYVITLLIKKCCYSDFVRNLFEMALEKRLANVVTYNSYITAAGNNRKFEEAQRAFDMARENRLADVITYSSYITAAGNNGRFKEARRAFDEATSKWGLRNRLANVFTYSSYIILAGNLARVMRHLNGVYTQRFNRFVKRDGALFRGRYKAQLVEQDTYLLRVSRYIHLNPCVANMTKDPVSYEWSSYSSYVGNCKCCEWLYINQILKQIEGRELYKQYVECGNDDEIEKIYNQKYCSAILGDKAFKLKHLEVLEPKKTEESLPDIKRTKSVPAITAIIEQVAIYFNVNCEKIFIGRRGIENLPRVLTMLICRHFFGHKLSEVAVCISGVKSTAISSIDKRAVKRLNTDPKFQKQYEQILKEL